MPPTAAAATFEPMYATVGTAVPDGRPGDWAFEPKYDGIRVLAFAGARGASLVTRNGKDKAQQFPEIVRALAALASRRGHLLTLDGETVALDRAGGARARFQQLQSRMHVKNAEMIAQHEQGAPAAFVAFDLLRDGDRTLLREPWRERRRQLERLLTPAPGDPIRLGESTFAHGAALLDQAHREGWEGIIAKRAAATYRPGARSSDWLTLKIEFRQEFVVGGFTEPRNTREHLGALPSATSTTTAASSTSATPEAASPATGSARCGRGSIRWSVRRHHSRTRHAPTSQHTGSRRGSWSR